MKRYVILAACILIQTCLGSLYAWSAFVPSLMDDYGVSGGRAGLIFGVAIAVFTLVMLYAGRLQDRRGPRFVAIIGAVIFGAGFLVASFSGGSYAVLFIGAGLLVGVGTGFGYVCPLATAVKWFPKRKGLITGIAVAGFGGGGVLLSELVEWLLRGGMDVMNIFRLVGVVYGGAIFLAALLLSVPEHHARHAHHAAFRVRELFAHIEFYALLLGMFAGTFGGLLVIGNLKPMGIDFALSAERAATAVGVFALGNALGRVTWGVIYDRIGRIAIPISLMTLMLGVLAPLAIAGEISFIAISGLMGFGFGACFVLYAVHVTTLYGHERMGSVYPVVFLMYGVSGIIGPATGGAIFDATGGYGPAILVAAGVLLVGFIGASILCAFAARKEIEHAPAIEEFVGAEIEAVTDMDDE